VYVFVCLVHLSRCHSLHRIHLHAASCQALHIACVCVCVCVCARVCVCMRLFTSPGAIRCTESICMQLHSKRYTCVCVCVCVCVCACVYAFVRLVHLSRCHSLHRVHLHAASCQALHMHACVCLRMCVCVCSPRSPLQVPFAAQGPSACSFMPSATHA